MRDYQRDISFAQSSQEWELQEKTCINWTNAKPFKVTIYLVEDPCGMHILALAHFCNIELWLVVDKNTELAMFPNSTLTLWWYANKKQSVCIFYLNYASIVLNCSYKSNKKNDYSLKTCNNQTTILFLLQCWRWCSKWCRHFDSWFR